MKSEVTYGNSFLALGFDEPEASNLKTRADLMIKIRLIIEDEGMTQKEAAACFGTSQPRISALLKGQIEKFTVDALMNMMSHAGRPVTVVTRDEIQGLPARTTRRKVMNTLFPPPRR